MSQHTLFSEILKEIEGITVARRYRAETKLFAQGEAAQNVYVIENGLVKLTHLDGVGRQRIIALRFPGWIVGAALAIANRSSPVTAITLTECLLRPISVDLFRDALAKRTSLSTYLHQIHSLEVLDQLSRTIEVMALLARLRLRRWLWIFAQTLEPARTGSETRIKLPLKQYELAELIGVTPEHLSRLWKELYEEGLLSRRKEWLFIHNVRRLYIPNQPNRDWKGFDSDSILPSLDLD